MCSTLRKNDEKQEGEIPKILQNFRSRKKWFLSGGLNSENIDLALKTTGAQMIDLSSGIEETRGVKSFKLIKDFMAKIDSINLKN